MELARSSATDAELDRWRTGECHVFAVALHRRFGWPIHLVLDADETYWEDPADADNTIPAVVHAFALDREGNAWDIAGCRPEDLVGADLEGWVHVGTRDSDTCTSETALRTWVGCWSEDGDEPVDRPLAEYTEADVAEADDVALRVLADVPGFPVRCHRP